MLFWSVDLQISLGVFSRVSVKVKSQQVEALLFLESPCVAPEVIPPSPEARAGDCVE